MRRSLRTRPVSVVFGTVAAAALTLSACSGSTDSDSGEPRIVTSTNVWGAVAEAVAGDKAEVISLYTNAQGDPHEFEPSAGDTADVVDADVIVMNGGHYDAYLEDAAAGSEAVVIDAFALLGSDGHGQSTHGEHEHGDDEHGDTEDHGHVHDPSSANEHVFYDLAIVAEVAEDVAEALTELRPDDADYFAGRAEDFTAAVTGLRDRLAEIRETHDGTKVAQTEPLAGYLLEEAGLDDVAPAGFTQAVEAGQSPSAADRAKMEDLLADRVVAALIYNTQAIDAVTEAVLGTAANADVPVVEFTETLPDGVDDYVSWMQAQITALADALDAGRPADPTPGS